MTLTSRALGPIKVAADPVPEAPKVVFWISPRGSVVACESLDDAQKRATRFAGEHPGQMVGVYELVGFAYFPPVEADFTAVDRESETLMLAADEAYWRSSGNRLMTAAELAGYGPAELARRFTQGSLQEIYDYEFHIAIGEELERMDRLPTKFMCIAPGSWHPDVWHDVLRMRTLNSNQAARMVEKHLCPLQFDIVDRLIDCYSNPGDLIFDPFAGLGTVPYRAILKGRRGAGSELNAGSFLDAVHYCRAAEERLAVPTMFDLESCGPVLDDDAAATPPL